LRRGLGAQRVWVDPDEHATVDHMQPKPARQVALARRAAEHGDGVSVGRPLGRRIGAPRRRRRTRQWSERERADVLGRRLKRRQCTKRRRCAVEPPARLPVGLEHVQGRPADHGAPRRSRLWLIERGDAQPSPRPCRPARSLRAHLPLEPAQRIDLKAKARNRDDDRVSWPRPERTEHARAAERRRRPRAGVHAPSRGPLKATARQRFMRGRGAHLDDLPAGSRHSNDFALRHDHSPGDALKLAYSRAR